MREYDSVELKPGESGSTVILSAWERAVFGRPQVGGFWCSFQRDSCTNESSPAVSLCFFFSPLPVFMISIMSVWLWYALQSKLWLPWFNRWKVLPALPHWEHWNGAAYGPVVLGACFLCWSLRCIRILPVCKKSHWTMLSKGRVTEKTAKSTETQIVTNFFYCLWTCFQLNIKYHTGQKYSWCFVVKHGTGYQSCLLL